MNRSILLLCLFFGPFSLLAQGYKGDWLINGGFQFDHFTANDFQKSRGIYGLNTQLGYYFLRGVAAGAVLEFIRPYRGSTNISLSPFVRVNTINKRASPFAQVSTGIGRTYLRGFDELYQRYFQLNLRAGLAFNLAQTATADVYFNYLAVDRLKTQSWGAQKGEPRLSLGLSMSYYLPQSSSAADSILLVDNYLKKGNKTFGVEGFSIERDVLISRLFWAKQIKDHTQLSITWNNYAGPIGDDTPLVFWEILSINFKQYFLLKNNTYLAASAGPDAWILVLPRTDFDLDQRLFFHAKPSLVHFFKRSILDIGINVWSPLNKDLDEGQQRVSATAILGYEYFLTQRLSLRGEFWGALSGDNWLDNSLVFWEPVGNTHFQLGFHYFYQKQPKN